MTCEIESQQNDGTIQKKKRKNDVNTHIKTSEYDSTVKELYISMPSLGEIWFDERNKMVPTALQDLKIEGEAQLSQVHEDEIKGRGKNVLLTMPLLQETFYTLSEEVQSDKNSHCQKSESMENDITIPKKKRKYDIQRQINRNVNGNAVKQWQPSMPLLEECWFAESNDKVENNVITNLQAHVTQQHADEIERREKELLTMPLLEKAFYALCREVERPGDTDDTLGERQDLRKDETPSMQLCEISLKLLSKCWYNRRGCLASKNNLRSIQSEATERIVTHNETIGIRKAGKEGGIEENIKVFKEKAEK